MKKRIQNGSLTFAFLLLGQLVLAQVNFTEKAAAVGINHFHLSPGLIGAGLAVFDYNNDGWEDIWMTGGDKQDALYVNNGDGTFTENGFWAGLLITANYHTKGIVTGDINNDGWRDVFLVTRTESPNLLLLNNGDGTFISIGSFAGLSDDVAWSGAATMADFDQNGWLDIYVGNYIEDSDFIYDPTGQTIIGYAHTCQQNFLYLNNGDLTFTEWGSMAGAADEGCALATLATDFNLDGKVDLLVANDFGEWVLPNASLQNNGSDFLNNNQFNGMDKEMYGMGIASGDMDQDNDLDYYFTNIGSNALMENKKGHFEDIANVAGVEDEKAGDNLTVGWGAAFVDVDNDTDLDLFVANGFIPTLAFNQTSVENPDRLFLNKTVPDGETKQFEEVADISGLGDKGLARGMAHGDFDRDGDQDLVVLPTSGTAGPQDVDKALFYENETVNDNNWLDVKLEGTISNRDAFGAKMRVVVEDKKWMHEITSGSSHASQNTSIAHLGLGESDKVDNLIIEWPMGGKQILTNVMANQLLEVKEDTALFTEAKEIFEKTNIEAFAAPNPFIDKTTVFISNEKQQPLTLYLINGIGQSVGSWRTHGQQIEIATHHLPSGLYTLKIFANNKLINTLKLSVIGG